MVAACLGAIRLARERGLVEERGDFLWLPGQDLSQVRVPLNVRGRRGIRRFPPEELELALVHLTRASGAYELDSLVRQAARIFGFERAGASIQSELQDRIDAIVARSNAS